MSYFKVCPFCGAHLDSGEVCDCRASMVGRLIMDMTEEQCAEVLKKTAPSAANTEDGKGTPQDH